MATIFIYSSFPGFLDPSCTEDDLRAGSNVEIPLWLAESLFTRRPPLVTVDLPKIYKDAYREILNADACTVDMHKLGQYFYELGCYVAKHDIKGEVASTLVNVSYCTTYKSTIIYYTVQLCFVIMELKNNSVKWTASSFI